MLKGIRFVDIRCRNLEGGLCIHHGKYYLDTTFNEVLWELTTCPSLVIRLGSVKAESIPTTMCPVFVSYMFVRLGSSRAESVPITMCPVCVIRSSNSSLDLYLSLCVRCLLVIIYTYYSYS